MLVSTKGRYALRMMLQLAENPDKPVRIKEVASCQDISPKEQNCHHAQDKQKNLLHITCFLQLCHSDIRVELPVNKVGVPSFIFPARGNASVLEEE